MTTETIIDVAKKHGARDAAIISVDKINFRTEFRHACEQNSCGKYGRCWMCPPDVGNIEDLIEQAKKYNYVFVYQSIGELEDSYDIEGMEAAAKYHNYLTTKLREKLDYELSHPLVLGAGACHVCPVCTKIENKPCRFPHKAIASLEAYGIAVSELAESCGLKYINGINTVTYFGAFLYM